MPPWLIYTRDSFDVQGFAFGIGRTSQKLSFEWVFVTVSIPIAIDLSCKVRLFSVREAPVL